jgi:hypothetical protein
MKLTERFTRIEPDVITYEVRVEDPKTYVKPFTITMPLTAPPGFQILPYECHEGNYMIANSLRAERVEDKALAEDLKKGLSGRATRSRPATSSAVVAGAVEARVARAVRPHHNLPLSHIRAVTQGGRRPSNGRFNSARTGGPHGLALGTAYRRRLVFPWGYADMISGSHKVASRARDQLHKETGLVCGRHR